MNLQLACFVAVVCFLTPPLAPAQNLPALDGLWLTDGYGKLLEFQGNDLRIFEITKVSCIPAEKATRKSATVFATDDDTFRIAPGPAPNTLWFHEDGAIQNILLRRTSFRPASCDRPLPDTPLTNYQVFWQTFAEQYAFFALRKVDWPAADRHVRPQVTADTKPEELFRILSGMVEPLHDKHVSINAPSIHKAFRGGRPATDTLQDADKPRVAEIIQTKYAAGGLRDFCNGQLQHGLLRQAPGAIAYLRIHSFARYSKDDDFANQLAALPPALDEIFKDAAAWNGLIIDIRINSGGFDEFGLTIASRLTAVDYVAWKKFARDDARGPDHHSAPQTAMVRAGHGPGFRGPVVLLTSAHGVSAAETFAMALLGRHPHVTRIGASTQGVFSDQLSRRLPNGWTFALSNETYLAGDGRGFEGTGVPPDIEAPIFPKEDLVNGRDSALDKALERLARRGR